MKSLLKFLGSIFLGAAFSAFPNVTGPTTPPPVIARKEDAEAKPAAAETAAPAERVTPASAAELASLERMCGEDQELCERLISCAQARGPGRGASWAVGKAEYDLWRDRR